MKLKYLLPGLALVAGQASAEVDINGFATIAGGKTLDSDQTLINYNEDFSFENDSLFGIQISSQLEDDLSFTGQIVSRGVTDWDAAVEWAYITYEPSDNVRFQVGKQRAPYYMFTDFVDVGFAYHWISAPFGAYDIPVGTVIGVNSIFSGNFGPVDSEVQVLFGRERGNTFLDGKNRRSDIKNLKQVAWSLNYEWLTFRVSTAETELALEFEELQPLIAGWSSPQLAPFNGIADELMLNEDNATFDAIGFKADFENFQLLGEFVSFQADNSFVADEEESFYLSGVYRFDEVSFHLTYGEDEAANSLGSVVGVPTGISNSLDILREETVNLLEGRQQNASHITLGMRWDFTPAAAFKVELIQHDDELANKQTDVLRFALTTYF